MKCCENFFYKPSVRRQHGSNTGETCVKRCAASLDTIFCHSKKNREEKKNVDAPVGGKIETGYVTGRMTEMKTGSLTATFKATVVKPSVDILTSVNVAVKNCPSNCPSSFPRKSWRDSGGDD